MLNFLYFLAAIFIAWFIPGDLLLGKINKKLFSRLVLGIIIGMVLWGWQGYILGFLQLRILSYLYLAIAVIFWLKNRYRQFYQSLNQTRIKFDWIALVIISLGVLVQLSAVFFTGISRDSGFFVCCGNTSDSLWHLALTNELVKRFPPYEPGMFGVVVHNYHYWSNLVIADLIRIFHLPLIETSYQYSLFLISVLLGLSAVVFSDFAKLTKNFKYWLLFFLYFGGDLIYLIILLTRQVIDFRMSSIEDGAKFLINPPRAYSIIVFFGLLSLLTLLKKNRSLILEIILGLICASLIGFKVYSGIFAAIGLTSLALLGIFKKDFSYLRILVIFSLLSLVVYLPVNINSGGLYFTGFWQFENFIVQPFLNLGRLELARKIFWDDHKYLKAAYYDLIFGMIFLLSIFGTKILAIFQTKNSLKKIPSEINIFLISGLTVSLLTGLFFQQSSGGANTFNFLVSVFIIGSIFTALAVSYWQEKIKHQVFKFAFIFLIVAFTLPRVLDSLYNNLENIYNRKGFFLYPDEVAAFEFIKNKTAPSSLLLIDPNLKESINTPYVSFITDRPVYLTGQLILESHGVDSNKRLEVTENIIKSKDLSLITGLLQKNSINYIIAPSNIDFAASESAYFIKPVFSDIRTKIFEVDHKLIDKFWKDKVNLPAQ